MDKMDTVRISSDPTSVTILTGNKKVVFDDVFVDIFPNYVLIMRPGDDEKDKLKPVALYNLDAFDIIYFEDEDAE